MPSYNSTFGEASDVKAPTSLTFKFKALYFLLWGGYGVGPYIPLLFENLHFTKSQIGVLSMTPNVSAFLAAPVCTIISDTYSIRYEVMIASLSVFGLHELYAHVDYRLTLELCSRHTTLPFLFQQIYITTSLSPE